VCVCVCVCALLKGGEKNRNGREVEMYSQRTVRLLAVMLEGHTKERKVLTNMS
jgi:hypothetical protein